MGFAIASDVSGGRAEQHAQALPDARDFTIQGQATSGIGVLMAARSLPTQYGPQTSPPTPQQAPTTRPARTRSGSVGPDYLTSGAQCGLDRGSLGWPRPQCCGHRF
jgi:hypothetical protein